MNTEEYEKKQLEDLLDEMDGEEEEPKKSKISFFKDKIKFSIKDSTIQKIEKIKEKTKSGLDIVQNSIGIFAMVSNSEKLKYVLLGTNIASSILNQIPNFKPVKTTPNNFGYNWKIRSEVVLGPCTQIFAPIIEDLSADLKEVKIVDRSFKEIEGENMLIETSSDYIFWCKDEQLEDAEKRVEKYILNLIKTKYNSNSYIVETKELLGTNQIVLRKNDREIQENLLSVDKIDAIHDMLMLYLNKGYNRSVILDGEPGCGKSIAIRHITDRLSRESDKKILHIVSTDAFDDVSIIIQLIKLLDIRIAIIDDFDRLQDSEYLLTQIELLRESLDLLFISTNHLSEMDDAMKRPGRFDQVIKFDNVLDKNEFIEKMDYTFDDEFIEKLKELSIASICEFTKRVDVLGGELAIETFDDLEER